MLIKIKYKGSKVEIENNHKYDNHIDVREFFLNVITTTIDKINEKLI